MNMILLNLLGGIRKFSLINEPVIEGFGKWNYILQDNILELKKLILKFLIEINIKGKRKTN
jgi:hypothetical protein